MRVIYIIILLHLVFLNADGATRKHRHTSKRNLNGPTWRERVIYEQERRERDRDDRPRGFTISFNQIKAAIQIGKKIRESRKANR